MRNSDLFTSTYLSNKTRLQNGNRFDSAHRNMSIYFYGYLHHAHCASEAVREKNVYTKEYKATVLVYYSGELVFQSMLKLRCFQFNYFPFQTNKLDEITTITK